MKSRYLKFLLISIALLALFYGVGRLYYQVTGGFLVSNITSGHGYDSRWETAEASEETKKALDQKFTYLGKGCQSYVFASDDGAYVLKFFKYQRFRPQNWVNYFRFIPVVDNLQLEKIEKKKNKLEAIYTSWKIANDHLRPETGVVYVHLNKTQDLFKPIEIKDKLGLRHTISLDDTEFMLQKRAVMLCPTLDKMMADQQEEKAIELIDKIVAMVLSENQRGLADHDNALMQNTGVIDGEPVHIDIGQFVQSEKMKDPAIYHHELFSKTWKFRRWLEKRYPTLHVHLTNKLHAMIGPEMNTMVPRLHTVDEGLGLTDF